jgi:hypothetical protein
MSSEDNTSNQQSFSRKIPTSSENQKKLIEDRTKSVENWQNPLNQLIFKKAFKARATEITTRDGRKFSVDYETRSISKLDGGKEKATFAYVKIIKQKPSENMFAPAGWFNVDNYLKGS